MANTAVSSFKLKFHFYPFLRVSTDFALGEYAPGVQLSFLRVWVQNQLVNQR